MLSYLKKLLTRAKPDKPELVSYEIESDKSKHTEIVKDEVFYVHAEPKPPPLEEDIDMPSVLEEPDNVNTSQVEIIDEKTGQKVIVDSSVVAQHLNRVPAGISIPGLGVFGTEQQKKTQRQPRQQQQRPQQPQQPVNTSGTVHIQDNPTTTGSQVRVQTSSASGAYPPIEMAMVEGEYHVFMDLAGLKKDELSIKFVDGTLIVSGNRESNVENLRKQLRKKTKNNRTDPILQESSTVMEYLMGKFEFKLPFKKMIDESNIGASYEDGILHITLPHRVKGNEVSIAVM